ncbi:gibberellin 3-beta-dioxygenase 1 [Phtheirospermum japonicum]|uniref:Gibberellin 3-beta-dioxygenase 1 n=1 Tax=Phtheirospermum japonicum TaxID=374723 RepID=A0A830D9H6_9LAMI|nr:gibberellin 3-beta-dioxygenase 1 [Phtheirospermum japonicum]
MTKTPLSSSAMHARLGGCSKSSTTIFQRACSTRSSRRERAVFAPPHQKLQAARQPGDVSGYGLARISSFFPKLMWSEGFTIAGSPIEHARLLWPDDYQTFCDTIEEYQKATKALAGRLMWLMLGWLGITEEDNVKWAENGSSAMQLNSYPACPDPDRAMGLAAHTDSTILTILHQSNTSGLQRAAPGRREPEPAEVVRGVPVWAAVEREDRPTSEAG